MGSLWLSLIVSSLVLVGGWVVSRLGGGWVCFLRFSLVFFRLFVVGSKYRIEGVLEDSI